MEICYSPLAGKTVNLDHVADEMFSQRMLGDGIAVEPEASEIYSPVAGEITMFMKPSTQSALKRRRMLKFCCISASTPSCWGERHLKQRCRSAIMCVRAIF